MPAVGMLAMGAFIGYIILYALRQVKNWDNPVATLNGILAAAVAAGLFALIERSGGSPIAEAVFYYPVGLAYGALCNGIEWVGKDEETPSKARALHIVGFVVATLLILALVLFPRLLEREDARKQVQHSTKAEGSPQSDIGDSGQDNSAD